MLILKIGYLLHDTLVLSIKIGEFGFGVGEKFISFFAEAAVFCSKDDYSG